MLLVALVMAAGSSICSAVQAQPLAERPAGAIQLEPPGERQFVLDRAELLNEAQERQIRELAAKLLSEKATPIVVVTINSMAEHGGDGMRIETFAHLLFDQWAIGHAKVNGELWNTGILFLVSKNDRKARIELGAGWKRDHDAQALLIMDQQIIPRFRQGQYAKGIIAGVEGLDRMARGLQLPRPPTPWWQPWVTAGVIGLAIFTIISLIRRGASGWAWLFWGALFSVIGYLLYTMANNRSSGGGGFSGGSFGGGYSGGGGASGSW